MRRNEISEINAAMIPKIWKFDAAKSRRNLTAKNICISARPEKFIARKYAKFIPRIVVKKSKEMAEEMKPEIAKKEIGSEKAK